MKKNKVLIVGYGSAAKRHISTFNKIKKNTFFFILSRKKKIFLRDNKINFKHIRKINEIYTEDINYSFICTGANEHFKYLKILSKIKTNIFIEKPIVETIRTIKELRKIFKINKNKIYVGYNLLFSDSLNFLKKLNLKKRDINKVSVKAGYYLPLWREENYTVGVSSNKKKGGGVILELSHEINYLIWIFGRPLWTSALLNKSSNLKINVEDNAYIVLGFNTFNCIIELDFISKKYLRSCQIDTNDHSYFWKFKKNSVISFDKKNIRRILFNKKFNLDSIYEQQLKFFLKSKKIKLIKHFDNAIDTLKVIDAIRKSSKKKGLVQKIIYKD